MESNSQNSSQPASAVVRGAVLSDPVDPTAVVPASAVRTATNTMDPSNPSTPPASSPPSSVASSIVEDANTTLHFDFGTYVGEVDPTNGLRSGKGTFTYTSGNVYEGEWRDGAANGIGEKRYTNGDVYRGGWVAGKRSGRGGYLYARGHYFEGMYVDDESNGYGVLTTVGGDRYAGHWRNGMKDGKGRETLQGGQVFVGHWKDGKKQGRGKLFIPGAKSFIFGIWNQDHFFRELTEEEMGVDGEIDLVDQYGLPTDQTDPASAAAVSARTGALPPPLPPSQGLGVNLPPAPTVGFESRGVAGEGLGNALTDAFLSGVAAVENRLEALGRALEKATTGSDTQIQQQRRQGGGRFAVDPAEARAQPQTQPQLSGAMDESDEDDREAAKNAEEEAARHRNEVAVAVEEVQATVAAATAGELQEAQPAGDAGSPADALLNPELLQRHDPIDDKP